MSIEGTRALAIDQEIRSLQCSSTEAGSQYPAKPDVPMRRKVLLLLWLGLEGCSSISESAALEIPSPPDEKDLLSGTRTAVTDSHFAPPIEVTGLFKAPSISSSPWMVCIRSAKSDETRRITYSAFFKEKYVLSRYSVHNDGCSEQQFHPFVIPANASAPAPSPVAAPPPPPKKHRRGTSK
jgi:hypothetical protein